MGCKPPVCLNKIIHLRRPIGTYETNDVVPVSHVNDENASISPVIIVWSSRLNDPTFRFIIMKLPLITFVSFNVVVL